MSLRQGLGGEAPDVPRRRSPKKQEPAGAKRRSRFRSGCLKRRSRFCRLQGNARRRDHSGGRTAVSHRAKGFEIWFLVKREAKRAKETKLRRIRPRAKRQSRSFRTGIVAPSPGRLPVLAFFFMMGNVGGFQAGKRNRRASAPFRFQTFRLASSPTGRARLQSPKPHWGFHS